MDVSELNNEVCLYDKVYGNNCDSDLNGDYILPDYLADIKRILRVNTRVKNGGHYINENKLHYEGEVIYTILFVTDDNMLKSNIFTAVYEGTTQIVGMDSESVISLTPAVENLSYRMVNPRKVNIRCKCMNNITVYSKKCVEPKINGKHSIEDEINLERDISAVNVLYVGSSNQDDIRVSEDIELEGTLPQIKDIITCDIGMYVNECKAMQNKAMYKGDAIVNCIYESEIGDYISICRKIPITQIVDVDGLNEQSECGLFVKPVIDTIKYNTQKNSYDENRIIELDFTYNVSIECMTNRKLNITGDIYSTEYECATEYTGINLRKLARTYNTNFSVNASSPRNDENMVGVVDTTADSTITNIHFDSDKNRLIVEGKSNINAIASGNDGCIAINFNVPFKCELDGGAVNSVNGNEFECVCVSSVISSKGRLDSTNIYADLEIALNMMVFTKTGISVISSVTLDHEKPLSKESMMPLTLCYPVSGERLWDIAKYYKTTAHAIRCANSSIGEKSTVDNKVLIIPRKNQAHSKSVYSTLI